MSKGLTDLSQHFRFGENWQSFLSTVTEDVIAEAEAGLLRLFPDNVLQGARFLDIGCGSGLHLLSALRLGVSEARGVDLDPASVAATRTLLEERQPNAVCSAETRSVFDMTPDDDGRWRVVYSWGVLHHSGDMWNAIARAAALSEMNGFFALALYRKSAFCGFWRAEKWLYSKSPDFVQSVIRAIYKTIYRAGLLATGRNPAVYERSYKSARGMDWHHDVHDWLGGYPYESAAPREITDFLGRRGFSLVRQFQRPAAISGLLGTHCDEYVFQRTA